MTKNSLEYTKKLLYLSKYRGCKESEIIFGRFTERYLYKIDDIKLRAYEEILEYPDAKLMDWFMYKKDIPEKIKNNPVYELVVQCLEVG